MNITIITHNTNIIALVDDVTITGVQDFLDILVECRYNHNTDKIIIQQHSLTPEFFDLKTKLAGDILQKLSTYGGSLAIVGDFSHYSSQSLQDFIYESNHTGRVNFVSSEEQAIEALTKIV